MVMNAFRYLFLASATVHTHEINTLM